MLIVYILYHHYSSMYSTLQSSLNLTCSVQYKWEALQDDTQKQMPGWGWYRLSEKKFKENPGTYIS